ncbi:hypothetical protein APB76_09730 [Vibrio bivalvicida]|uniref:Metallo-beta-lactamase domain-containing protein n=2 Tax=Vibrio bivalvicida TaxID=1276888 RepID=A0A177Y0V1_9VIBR|nr:hypothetical protein APB76_09730 [Vibrio bivalvicida]
MLIDILDASHGDCILITCDEVLVLIDSGPKKLKVRQVVVERLSTLLKGKSIDLAIVTHNDDDHIGGFKYLLESGISIKSFIFNSIDILPKIVKPNKKIKKISFRQDRQLYRLLNDSEVKVGTLQFESNPIELGGLKITPLTPNHAILSKLNEKVERKNKRISAHQRIEPSIESCIDEIKAGDDLFVEDRSITNRSSVSVILEFQGKRALFLGDCHPSDLISAIHEKQFDDTRFDIVKLSHHGSEKNTSSELIEILGETEYILCADKSNHGHPNNKTISRILMQYPSATFHLSASNELLSSIFSSCINLGYPVTTSIPTEGVNRVQL